MPATPFREQGPAQPKISLQQVGKHFQAGRAVLEGIDLSIADGEFVALVGPSGCGKSTILKLVSGLVRASSGTVRLDGVAVEGPAPGVGYMFQSDALLPWASVEDNIALGLDLNRQPVHDRSARLAELVRTVGLQGFEKYYPAALSGGMRQRVSIARTLAYEPALYLLDEPFGALDAQTKLLLGQEFVNIWLRRRNTTLLVTHDITEALLLADRVLVMQSNPGRIQLDLAVDIPRPRDIRELQGTARFSFLYKLVWDCLMGHPAETEHPQHERLQQRTDQDRLSVLGSGG